MTDPPVAPSDAHGRGIILLERAVAAGEPSAPAVLARGYLGRGRLDDARALLADQVRAGRTDLARRLADVLDEPAEAERVYRIAKESGDIDILNDFGLFLAGSGRAPKAISFFRRAIEAGDVLAPATWRYFSAGRARSRPVEKVEVTPVV